MTSPKCARCQQWVLVDDTVRFDGDQIVHLDCRRPRGLSQEERALLFQYCFDHAVAECTTCAQDFRQHELAADLLGSRTHLCPRCRVDLTERVRHHLYGCAMLPGDIRWTVRAARAAAQRLLKVSHRVVEGTGGHSRETDASVAADGALIQEARGALDALRELMRRSPPGDEDGTVRQ